MFVKKKFRKVTKMYLVKLTFEKITFIVFSLTTSNLISRLVNDFVVDTMCADLVINKQDVILVLNIFDIATEFFYKLHVAVLKGCNANLYSDKIFRKKLVINKPKNLIYFFFLNHL